MKFAARSNTQGRKVPVIALTSKRKAGRVAKPTIKSAKIAAEKIRKARIKAINAKVDASSAVDVTTIVVTPEDLRKALEKARRRKMGREEREAQMVSFVRGNALEGRFDTYETIREIVGL